MVEVAAHSFSLLYGLMAAILMVPSPSPDKLLPLFGYGSIPIDTIFRGMNIHLPAILMFTRGTRF
jgi:hypothetical protein